MSANMKNPKMYKFTVKLDTFWPKKKEFVGTGIVQSGNGWITIVDISTYNSNTVAAFAPGSWKYITREQINETVPNSPDDK